MRISSNPARFLLLLLLFFALTAKAQQYPVKVTVSILPPYSPYLSGYTRSQVLVTLQNTGRTAIDIKLAGSITGSNSGISIVMDPTYKPASPITLNINQVIVFNGLTLKNYFSFADAQHITVRGMDKNKVIHDQALPEDDYSLCLRAYNYNTSEPESEEDPSGCFSFGVNYMEPPTLISPLCGDTLKSSMPLSINFSWTLPSGARGVMPNNLRYKLKIVDLIPQSRNPNDAINSSTTPSFFEKELSSLNYLYSPADPQLEAGHRYALQVTVVDPAGKLYFTNDGRSEVCSFVFWRKISGTPGGGTTHPVPAPVPGGAITLLQPADGYQVKTINGGTQFEHLSFHWKDAAGIKAKDYVLTIVELEDGQTPEQALALKQYAYGTPVQYETDSKSDPQDMHENYSEPPQGKHFAWRIMATDYNGHSLHDSSSFFTFNTPALANDVISSFTMSGYTIYVSQADGKDATHYSGKGYLYAWSGGPTVPLSFSQLDLGNFGFDGKNKTDWRCISGSIDILNIPGNISKSYTLPAEVSGDFEFLLTGIFLKAYLPSHFDNAQSKFIPEAQDPTLNTANASGSIQWSAPFQVSVGGMYYDPFMKKTMSFSSLSNALIGTQPGTFQITDVKTFGLKGSSAIDKTYDLALSMPVNCHLKLYTYSSPTGGCTFAIDGALASVSLSGSFSIPTGVSYEGDEHFDFQNVASLIIPVSFANTSYIVPLDFNTEIVSTFDKGYICLTNEAEAPGASKYFYGLFVPDFTVSCNILHCNFSINAHNAYNYGEGFTFSGTYQDAASGSIQKFPTQFSSTVMAANKSRLQMLDLEGSLHIPFLEADATVSEYADWNGLQDASITMPGDNYLVYNKDGNQVHVTPYNMTLANGQVTLDGSYSFSSTDGKNMNIAGLMAYNWFILPNGNIGSNAWFNILSDQISGTYNGFEFKATSFSFKSTGDHTYSFGVTGFPVLEEATLAVKYASTVTIAFNTNPSTETPVFASADEDADGAHFIDADANSYTVTKIAVPAGFAGSSLDFDADFIYFDGEDIYGSGFKADVSITSGDVSVGGSPEKLSMGAMVGLTKENYRYWYVEAGVDNINPPIETGLLDLSIYGFHGRCYYHMRHVAETNTVLGTDYVPDDGTLFGIYAQTPIETASSNGALFWATVNTEISCGPYGAPNDIHIWGDGYVMSTGAGSTDGLFHGTGDFHLYPTQPSFTGYLSADADILGLMQTTSTVSVDMSTSKIYFGCSDVYYVALVGQNLWGSSSVTYWPGDKIQVDAGFGGTLYDFGVHRHGTVIHICDYSIDAGLKIGGDIKASVVYPNFHFSGAISAYATLYLDGSLCGVSAGTSVGCWYVGEVQFPSPMCIAGEMGFDLPWPLPDWSFGCRIKDGTFGWRKSTCAQP